MVLTLETESASILQDLPDIDWNATNDVEELQKKVENAKLAAKLHNSASTQVRVIILSRILARIDCGLTGSMEYQEAKPSLLRTIYNDGEIMPRDEHYLSALVEEWSLIQTWIDGDCSETLPPPRPAS